MYSRSEISPSSESRGTTEYKSSCSSLMRFMASATWSPCRLHNSHHQAKSLELSPAVRKVLHDI